MKPQTIEEKVQWYAMLHGQNLNGRETEDELFEAGIKVGIKETEELRDEFASEFGRWIIQNQEIENTSSWSEDTANYYLKEFKKEKGL
jgi:hypothetical protein